MSEPSPTPDSQRESSVPKGANPVASATPDAAAATPPTPANKLTPEEQMAAFEKDLKENDWGHQPC